MAEAPLNSNGTNPDPAGGGDGKTAPQAGGNTPPATQPQGGTPPAGTPDLKELDADQLKEVLENPNLWNLPRVKELRDAKAQLDKVTADQQKANEQKLKDEKKWEELSQQKETENSSLREQLQNFKIDQALTTKLVPEGVVDLEAALKLADRSKIKVDDNGTVTGVDEALEALKSSKAYLFGQPGQPKVGGPTNPSNAPSGPAKFKRSQLRDPKFYAEHRQEILEASKQGLIEDDVTPAALNK